MSSSSVQFAQNVGGGASFVRQQSMSAGGLAQATVMQQHALPNGLQATQVVQQRTLTNGSTMMVQQRTLTTGPGGVQQQTVVQQHVTAPNTATVLQQSRQQQQHQHMMQRRAVRMTPVLGAPMLQGQQRLVRPAFITGGGNVVGPRLIRGSAGSQASVMQQLVRQRYLGASLGGPVMPGRGIQLLAGRPVRVKMTYPREHLPIENL